MSEMICVQDLSYVYAPGMPNEIKALDGISFSVQKGEFLGIIGATGCGKSTLISHLNGMLRPTAGKVLIDGVDLWQAPEQLRALRFRVGLVFQYPEYQLFEETVEKDIAFGPRNMGLSDDEIARRVQRAAQFCGLSPEMMGRSPFDLSGGQKRRAAIAGVLAMEPQVLVLDEPAAGLDPEGRDTILGQMKQYHRQTGATILLVSHSMEDIAKYAERVLVLSGGRVAMHDTTAAVFARAQELLTLGLSVPEITKVFLRLRELGLDVPANVYTLSYATEQIMKIYQKGAGAPC